MRTPSILIIIALLLTACGGQATPTPAPAVEQPAATQAPAVMESPTQPAAAPTDAPAVENTPAPAPAAGTQVYHILPGESTLQYEVGEVFINDNNRFATAIGVTSQVQGDVTIDPLAPQNSTLGPITADISQFKSDSGRRDNAIRDRFLQSSTYPTVTFVASSIDGLPASYQEGQELNLVITGDLTIRDVTKPAQFNTVLRLSGGTLTGEANTTILMSDFGFGPISLAGMLKTEDEVKIKLTFTARP